MRDETRAALRLAVKEVLDNLGDYDELPIALDMVMKTIDDVHDILRRNMALVEDVKLRMPTALVTVALIKSSMMALEDDMRRPPEKRQER